jgi:uncharacterized protein DUF4136
MYGNYRIREPAGTGRQFRQTVHVQIFAGQKYSGRYKRILEGVFGQVLLSALNAKGYRFFPGRQKTDLFVAYHLALAGNETLAGLDPNLAPGQTGMIKISKLQDPQHPGQVAKGTIVVDFIDPLRKKLLWRGWAKTKFEQVQPGPATQRLAKLAVDRILAKLPSRT